MYQLCNAAFCGLQFSLCKIVFLNVCVLHTSSQIYDLNELHKHNCYNGTVIVSFYMHRLTLYLTIVINIYYLCIHTTTQHFD